MSPSSPISDARLVYASLHQFHAKLKRYDSRRREAGEIAVRVELFRLYEQLKQDLRSGTVAGTAFRPLRVVSRGTRASRKPLARLATAVRYQVKKDGDKKVFSVGFDGPQSSRTWRRIAHAIQDGREIDPDRTLLIRGTLRENFAYKGIALEKRGKDEIAKFYFLRASTKKLKLEPRPIVEPFWKANRSNSEKNIISNFNRKLRGERI